MLIDEIREATGEMHEALDSALYPHIRNSRTKQEYALLLEIFYGFFKPVMDLVHSELDETFVEDIRTRRSATALLNDLQAIDSSAKEISLCNKVPPIYNKAQAMGAYYVLEGSTLGGVFLSKMIAENTGCTPVAGLSFFYGYGKESKQRWQLFTTAVNEAVLTVTEQKQVVESARLTFSYFNEWLQHSYANTDIRL
jgi:heme oxygenase